MSGTKIHFEVTHDSLTPALAGLLNAGENLYPFLDEIGGQLVTETQDRFEDGVGPDGGAWEVSAAARQRGGKTLKESNQLVTGLTHQANGNELVWGSNEVYAAIHQFGGETGRNKSVTLPARPFLGLSDADERMIEEEYSVFFGKAAGVS